MWVLVFVYFYETTPYIEAVTVHSSMVECFYAREALSDEVGRGSTLDKIDRNTLLG